MSWRRYIRKMANVSPSSLWEYVSDPKMIPVRLASRPPVSSLDAIRFLFPEVSQSPAESCLLEFLNNHRFVEEINRNMLGRRKRRVRYVNWHELTYMLVRLCRPAVMIETGDTRITGATLCQHWPRPDARLALILLAPLLLGAQNLKEFEKKVSEFTLANGLHFIVVERHEAPVVSFHTYVNAGSVDDPSGESGIAHMFEHMAFKGTESIGSRNWPEEKKAIQRVEEVYDRLEAERNKGVHADQKKIQSLETELKLAMESADAYVEPNLYPRIIEENGGAGMNASTGVDATEYFYSLPSNRIELWFLLESQRFLQPVFREFYKERDVVMEEYRMRVESDPQGKLMQTFLATAFEAHPYRTVGAGWPSDIASLRRAEAWQFFRKYYVPANITMGIAGDVDAAQARRLAERYFAAMPERPLPPALHTVDPPQEGPKLAKVQSPSQPLLMAGYKRPDQYDPDDPVFDVISGILAGGRTGLLYKTMVRDKRISLIATAADTFPGGKYPSLFLFFLAPSLGHTIQENEKAFYDLLERFKTEKLNPDDLARVKTKTRAGLIRRLSGNSGLAAMLTAYYANYGDWRKLFTSLNDIDKVTAEDVQRVAQKYFIPEHRTVAYTFQPKQAGGAK